MPKWRNRPKWLGGKGQPIVDVDGEEGNMTTDPALYSNIQAAIDEFDELEGAAAKRREVFIAAQERIAALEDSIETWRAALQERDGEVAELDKRIATKDTIIADLQRKMAAGSQPRRRARQAAAPGANSQQGGAQVGVADDGGPPPMRQRSGI